MIKNPLLNTYWIKSPTTEGFGFGVTACSKEDAFLLLGKAGCILPPDNLEICVTEGIKLSDLDRNHVLPNIGPLLFRGVWFPFLNL